MASKQEKIEKLKKLTEQSDFWSNSQKAAGISREVSDLEDEIELFQEIKSQIGELLELAQIIEEKEEGLVAELEKRTEGLEKRIAKISLQTYLGGKYDRGDAILEIYAGAGGREAQDWAAILARMYQRYAEKKNWEINVLDRSFGEPGGPEGRIGLKNIVMEAKGKFAFGFLKNESGVHRLVRLSPFSSQQLRHTSFAQVVVFPKIKEKEIAKIPEKDLKTETFRSSGPGGQYMQKTESAVRLTHIPTGIVVSCQAGRSQGQNRLKAMEILLAKLYQKKEQERQKNLEAMKGEIDPAWGKQIRNYVLDKSLIKDVRTQVETSKIEEVLDGDLDEFIEAEIKLETKQLKS